MLFKKITLWSSLALMLCLGACKSVEFISASKYKIMPGVPTGTPVHRFELELKVDKPTKFLEVMLHDSIASIRKFSVEDKATHKQSDNSIIYAPGTYILSFDIAPASPTGITDGDMIYVVIQRIDTINKKIFKPKMLNASLRVLPDKRLR